MVSDATIEKIATIATLGVISIGILAADPTSTNGVIVAVAVISGIAGFTYPSTVLLTTATMTPPGERK